MTSRNLGPAGAQEFVCVTTNREGSGRVNLRFRPRVEKSENLVEFEEEKISVQTPEILLILFIARSCVFRACRASGLLLDFTRLHPADFLIG